MHTCPSYWYFPTVHGSWFCIKVNFLKCFTLMLYEWYKRTWGLLWLILIWVTGRHIWATLMPSWVTPNSFLLSLCPFARCEENVSKHTTPSAFLWVFLGPFPADRLGHAQFNLSLLHLNTPNSSIATFGTTQTVKSEVITIKVRIKHYLQPHWFNHFLFLPTGPCWRWAVG